MGQSILNPFQRWQKRYFVLNDHILTYCDQPGGRPKGQIHLKVAGINESKDDALRIIINTGTGQILLKVSNVEEKNKWLIALKKNQEYCQRDQVLNYGQKIQVLLTDIWSKFALFDEQLTYLQEKATLNMYKETHEIINLGQYLKNGITLCCTLIEEENIKLYGESDTIYESFDFENEIPLNTQSSNYIIRQEVQKQHQLENFNSLQTIKLSNPIKYNNIKYNRVYSRQKLTNEATRKCLPHKQDSDEKFAFQPFLKECIGKDLTRIPMPFIISSASICFTIFCIFI